MGPHARPPGAQEGGPLTRGIGRRRGPRDRRDPSPRPLPWPEVLARLAAHYQVGLWRVPYLKAHAEDPFQVLVATVLSQRTRDETTDRVAEQLFQAYPTPAALARAPPARLRRILRPVGFYATKARGIRALSRQILERHGGAVPRDLEALLALPMVGRKTANCTLVFGFGIPAIPVDTHVHRLANRLGAVRTRTPEGTEEALRRTVPESLWVPLNPLLVQHGQNVCLPRRPRCGVCPLVDLCETGEAFLRDRGEGSPRTVKGRAR
jgi:endonuclease-3